MRPVKLGLVAASIPAALVAAALTAPAEWALYDARLSLRQRTSGWAVRLVTTSALEPESLSQGTAAAFTLTALIREAESEAASTLVLDAFLGEVSDSVVSVLAESKIPIVTAVVFDPHAGRRPSAEEMRAAMIPASGGPRVRSEVVSFPSRALPKNVVLGHAGIRAVDSIRSSPPLVRVEGFEGALPSQALAAVLAAHEIAPEEVTVERGRLRYADWFPTIPIRGGDVLLDIKPHWPHVASEFDTFRSIRPGPRETIFVVGTPHGDVHRSPYGNETLGSALLVAAIQTLLNGNVPYVLSPLVSILSIVVGSLVAMALPGRRTRVLALLTLGFTWVAASVLLVPVADVFLPLISPFVVLAFGVTAAALRD